MSMYADALGTEPAEIVRAENYEAVQQAVCRAAEAKQATIPWGGGTAQTYGYLPERAGILLDLSPMNRVLAHEPGDLTVTVEAGATLQAVQDALAEKNQFLPIDAGHPEQATVGGIIAADAWGAGRTGYGTVRDWLLGLTVVDAHGKIVKGGGKVVKNVTGYDTPKLHVGGLGTLGVIVEATFKVAPRPEAARPLLFILPNGDAADLAPFLARLLRETAPRSRFCRTKPRRACWPSCTRAMRRSQIARGRSRREHRVGVRFRGCARFAARRFPSPRTRKRGRYGSSAYRANRRPPCKRRRPASSLCQFRISGRENTADCDAPGDRTYDVFSVRLARHDGGNPRSPNDTSGGRNANAARVFARAQPLAGPHPRLPHLVADPARAALDAKTQANPRPGKHAQSGPLSCVKAKIQTTKTPRATNVRKE